MSEEKPKKKTDYFYVVLVIVLLAISVSIFYLYIKQTDIHYKEMSIVSDYFCCDLINMTKCIPKFEENSTHFWFQCGTPIAIGEEGAMRLKTLTKAWEKDW
ncbi:MAG: hypothetical protein ACW99A_21555 [Candidatus Kariarchaeaceae archaeon]|jgi:hypothetical protein